MATLSAEAKSISNMILTSESMASLAYSAFGLRNLQK